jgi:hypothetical protein
VISLGITSCSFTLSDNQKNEFSIDQTEEIEVIKQDVRIDFASIDEIYVIEWLTIKNIQNVSITELVFWPSLNKDFRNINVEDEDSSPITSIPDYFERSITIHFDQTINTNQSFIFRVDYYCDISLDPIGPKKPYYYHFQISPKLTYFTHEYVIEIRLPKNSWLHEGDDIPFPYFPENGTYYTSGSRIYINWSFRDLEPDSSFPIFVWFDEPPDPSSPIWPYIIGPLFGIILGAAGVYWWMKKKETLVMKEVGKIFLTEDQKLLLNLIIESEGKITQKELIQKTGFTKSKISRNLTPLESNELITKERWGREYKVYITERGRKVIE